MSNHKRKSRFRPDVHIPKICSELQSVSPKKVADYIKLHFTERDRKTGRRRQLTVTPQSISMWFNRHPKEAQKLRAQIVRDELPSQAISETLFQKGVFEEHPLIKQWIIDLTNRDAKPPTITNFLHYVKRLCLGQVKCLNRATHHWKLIEGYGIRSPDTVTVNDALRFIYEMKKEGMHTRNARLAFRNFFKSRGFPERQIERITGKEEGAGKYAHVFAPRPKITAIFERLKERSLITRNASLFAYKTACRIGAVLTAEFRHVNPTEHTITVFEKASKGTAKARVTKLIPPDVWAALDFDHIDGKEGKIFDIRADVLNKYLRETYAEVIPELIDEIPKPFHFWRHQFAQHMLRALDWNYDLVAELGHWKDPNVLRRYYGKPPQAIIQAKGLTILPNI